MRIINLCAGCVVLNGPGMFEGGPDRHSFWSIKVNKMGHPKSFCRLRSPLCPSLARTVFMRPS